MTEITDSLYEKKNDARISFLLSEWQGEETCVLLRLSQDSRDKFLPI